MTLDNGPNVAANPDDAIRRAHLTHLLAELGDQNAVSIDGKTPVVDYYLASAQDPDSMVNSIPYDEATGMPAGGINDMKYGDVMKAQVVGNDFLTPERQGLAITVGLRVVALLRAPDVTRGLFANNPDWVAYWKDNS